MKNLLVILLLFTALTANALEHIKNEETKKQIPAYTNTSNTGANVSTSINTYDSTFEPSLLDNTLAYNTQLTLHKGKKFNLLMATHISQASIIFQEHSKLTASHTKNVLAITLESKGTPSIYSGINQTGQQYGLIGSYSVTPAWQVSGGIIHTSISPNLSNDQDDMNNVALIGTSYSF